VKRQHAADHGKFCLQQRLTGIGTTFLAIEGTTLLAWAGIFRGDVPYNRAIRISIILLTVRL
jgi:hypothetical protein